MTKYTLSDIFEGQYPISQVYGGDHYLTVNGKQVKASVYYGQFGLAGHEGVDWATPVGVRLVVPFETGKILRTGWDPIYGYYIVIWDASQKCAVWYCHLSSINVSAGQSIPRGKLVGYTGNSGNTQGAHLHCNLVETDQYANRLNTNNGFQGFLNILDPNLVTWQMGGSVPPLNDTQKVNAITKEMQTTNSNDTKVANIKKILGL